MELFRALRHGPFARLWVGQTISRLGDALQRVALAWWVLEKTGSAADMGIVLIFTSLPMLIFLLVGGVVVDRLPRVRVMLWADIISGVLIGSVALLAWTDRLVLWHIYGTGLIMGFLQAFFFPAYTATVPDITPAELLPSANSLTSLSRQVMGIFGPALGGFMVSWGGTPLAFTLNALSFFISAAFLFSIHTPPRATSAKAPSPLLGALLEGLRAVYTVPWVWITIVLFSLINIFVGGPLATALPLLVKTQFQAKADLLGWLQSFSAIGSVLGAVWLGRFAHLRRRGWLAYGSTIVSGLAFVVYGLPVPWFVIAGAAFMWGITIEWFGLIWTNTLQELIPPEKLGRVASIDALGSYVFMPIGFGLTGLAADHWGAPITFMVGGLVTAGLAGLALLHPAIHGLD